jgi:hypothetical protein
MAEESIEFIDINSITLIHNNNQCKINHSHLKISRYAY